MRLNKKTLFLSAICIMSLSGYAQQAAEAAPPTTTNTDFIMYVLVTIAFALLIAIAAMGSVFIRLAVHAYPPKSNIVKSTVICLMIASAFGLHAQDTTTAAAAPEHVSLSISFTYMVAISVILTEILVLGAMLARIWGLINIIDPKPQTSRSFRFELPVWFDRFNESVAIEHEKDIMLDHDYDGIKELDNQLPPWWKYGFALTIIWAICYLTYFHILRAAPLSAGEYVNEMAEAKVAKDAYMRTAKNNVDENTIVFDKSYIADGQKIFSENCVACHGQKGEGGVGPNLTDDNWLHGGKINDIFKTVKYGWPANGMKSWQADLTSMQIAQVVCYVKSLKGSNPPHPKAPQGDPYFDGDSLAKNGTAAVSDSVK